MEQVTIENTAKIIKLLGDKTRLTMLLLLKESDCCVCQFVEIFHMSQPSISQHIRKLKDVNLVTESRKGQWIFYSLNKANEFYPIISSVLDHLPEQEEKLAQLLEIEKRISCD